MTHFCFTLFLMLLFTPLHALCLRDWLSSMEDNDAFAYRSEQTVAMMRLQKSDPSLAKKRDWVWAQVSASLFFAQKNWEQWLDNPQTTSKGEMIWEVLLDLPLEHVENSRHWKPKLDLLDKVKGEIKWDIYVAKLPKDNPLYAHAKTLTLYVGSGKALKRANLPSPWPYWIETQIKWHKWVAYLVDVKLHGRKALTQETSL